MGVMRGRAWSVEGDVETGELLQTTQVEIRPVHHGTGFTRDFHTAEQTQRIIAEDVPVIPLYWRPRLLLARPDLCRLEGAGTAEDIWRNFAALDYGGACP